MSTNFAKEFKLFENLFSDKQTRKHTIQAGTKLEESKKSGRYKIYTSTTDGFEFFKDIHFPSELDTLIMALKKAGCTEIKLTVTADSYEKELPKFNVEVTDIYKLSKKISNASSIFVEASEFGINGFVEALGDSTDLAIGDDYDLDNIKALTADIIDGLNFLS